MKKHPEIRPDEIWVTNITPGDWHRIGWKTKRAGQIAYGMDENPVKSLFPVFVQRAELEQSPYKFRFDDENQTFVNRK